MLKIALVGVPDSGKSELAAVLTEALNTSGRPAAIVLIDNPAADAPDLASHDLLLLMGLDIRSTAGLAQEAADQQIRAALAHANIPYRVIYGRVEERLHHALQACGSLLKRATPAPDRAISATPPASDEAGKKASQWVWLCEKCSDPACEHRLLSDLLASRTATG